MRNRLVRRGRSPAIRVGLGETCSDRNVLRQAAAWANPCIRECAMPSLRTVCWNEFCPYRHLFDGIADEADRSLDSQLDEDDALPGDLCDPLSGFIVGGMQILTTR